MRNRLAEIRNRLGLLLCAAGLWLLAHPRRRHVASAYDKAGKLWSITAPAWCDDDMDTAYRVRRELSRGEEPRLPAGWRLEPREE